MINGRGQSLSGTGEAATLDIPLGAWRIAESQQVHPNEAPSQRGPTPHEAPEPIAVRAAFGTAAMLPCEGALRVRAGIVALSASVHPLIRLHRL